MPRSKFTKPRPLNNLGLILWKTGHFKDAIIKLEETIQLLSDIGLKETKTYISALNNLAAVHSFMGNLDESDRLYKDCLSITEILKDKIMSITLKLNMSYNELLRGINS